MLGGFEQGRLIVPQDEAVVGALLIEDLMDRLEELEVRLILPGERTRWNNQVRQHHYLKSARLVGEQLRYCQHSVIIAVLA
jgi:hypothetical protein